MAFKPNGIKVGTSILNQDTTVGNLNVFKCAEGFLESFPQSVYQLSLVLRTVSGEELTVFYSSSKTNVKFRQITIILVISTSG